MDQWSYGVWRWKLWSKSIPGIDTYDLIEECVSKGLLIPGEEMTEELWVKRQEVGG